MVKDSFLNLIAQYTSDENLMSRLWIEIEKQYSAKGRKYHSLNHIEALARELMEVESELRNRNAVWFALFYHDLIYNPLKKDNELKSAQYAALRMNHLGVPAFTTNASVNLILATQAHSKSNDVDTNYFTDADLSILGQEPEIYRQYTKGVRKEYSVFPDFIYNRGRKKVLIQFLEMERIFKTRHFSDKYESQAKLNLKAELDTL
ncbi:MAG: hypothetical protein R2850_11155 [Bacteroidia bacterium]